MVGLELAAAVERLVREQIEVRRRPREPDSLTLAKNPDIDDALESTKSSLQGHELVCVRNAIHVLLNVVFVRRDRRRARRDALEIDLLMRDNLKNAGKRAGGVAQRGDHREKKVLLALGRSSSC
eukprot:Amastigsp_a841147_405.p3 type:complete len:124 gc:universal Amastigsp_a841147_405:426-55(-)